MGEVMSEKLEKNLEQTASKKMRLLKLFWSTLYLSAFTFGGGYVIVSLMKKKFVDELGWIDEEEMLDLVAIAQSTPGAIAVNGAIVVGYKLEGIIGVIAAIAGTIIPPFVIIFLRAVCLKCVCAAGADRNAGRRWCSNCMCCI